MINTECGAWRRAVHVYTYMVSCQNYGPFLGTLNIRGRIIIGTQKRTIIFHNHPYMYIYTCILMCMHLCTLQKLIYVYIYIYIYIHTTYIPLYQCQIPHITLQTTYTPNPKLALHKGTLSRGTVLQGSKDTFAVMARRSR